MKNISPTIIFFGTEDFSLESLHRLIDAGYSIAAVVTKPDSKRGRGQIMTSPAVKELALKNDIPVWQPDSLSSIIDKVKILNSKPLGVLVSYGKIIPQSIIDLFDPGVINIHPSLLPNWRGPSPIESAIKSGDKKTGVTIMQLSKEMDAGPIYKQIAQPLHGNETRVELYEKLAKVGADLLIDVLPSILDGSLKATPQDDKKASYCPMLTKDDAYLNLQALDAHEAERTIRAHMGFPRSKLIINASTVIIKRAHASSSGTEPLSIKCRGGLFLTIDELIAPSGRAMTGQDFLNGYVAD